MSKLGIILLYVAALGAAVAATFGGLEIMEYNTTKATLATTQQQKAFAEADKKKADDAAAAAKQAQTDAEGKLATANTQVSDLTSKLTAAQSEADDAKKALDLANAATKTAQDALDKINQALAGQTVDELKAAEAKAQTDLAAAQSEQKILADSLESAQHQVADLKDEVNRKRTGDMPPGISGRVTFVNRTWNFVVLDVGLSNGVVPNGELIVYRDNKFLGKVKVTSAEANTAVADIMPNVKGDIQTGDFVLN
jgi:hypothetical protein